MLLQKEKLAARVKELEQRRFKKVLEIPVFHSQPGTLPSGDVYTTPPPAVLGEPFSLGNYFVGKDTYLWLENTLSLPPQKNQHSLVGRFDFGTKDSGGSSGMESLLWINNTPYQGVDSNHQEVVLDSFAGQNVTLTFLLWSGLGGRDIHKIHSHRFSRADIGYLHIPTHKLYYLLRVASESLHLLSPSDMNYQEILRISESTLLLLDWEEEGLSRTTPQALEFMQKEYEKIFQPSPVTVHGIGHTHIDLAYLWRIKHTREKAQRSFSSVLRLQEEYPRYYFLQTQPQIYAYLKEDNPDLYRKIQQQVTQGLWEVGGAMWVEADCNLSSGESLTRQLLYGIRFFQKEFGVTSDYLWLPDVFGYSWALPQLLKDAGIHTMMTTKISWNQYNTMPHDLFYWRGLDGSEILTYFITTPNPGSSFKDMRSTYNGVLSPHSVVGSWEKFKDKSLSSHVLTAYGYGDGGGGVTRDMLEIKEAMEQTPGLPQIHSGTAGEFFATLHHQVEPCKEKVPVWDGEMYLEYHRGTYTTHSALKRWNRRLEESLVLTEWLAVLDLLSGQPYPQQRLEDGWKSLLRQQFHDILPGSCIEEVAQDTLAEYQVLHQNLKEYTADFLQRHRTAAKDTYSFYHFGSFSRQEIVFLPEGRRGSFTANHGAVLGQHRTKDGYQLLLEIPPLTFVTVHFTPRTVEELPSVFSCKDKEITTPFYRIRWNAEGQLTSIYHHLLQRELLAAPGNALEIYEDKPLNYDAWDIDIFYTDRKEFPTLVGEPIIIENTPLRLVVEFSYHYRKSTLCQRMICYAHSPRIDFDTTVDWQETNRLLKATFPLQVRTLQATYDIPLGHVQRPTHQNTSWDKAKFEVVGHHWADLSQRGFGVSLLNNCKYGYSAKGSTLSLSLLRSPKMPDPTADMGEHHFTYAIFPHTGDLAETVQQGHALNLPLQQTTGALLAFELPVFSLTGEGIVLDCIKKAEDDTSLVVRLHETLGGTAPFTLTANFAAIEVSRCNLLEEPLEAYRTDDFVTGTLSPFEMRTYRFRWEKK